VTILNSTSPAIDPAMLRRLIAYHLTDATRFDPDNSDNIYASYVALQALEGDYGLKGAHRGSVFTAAGRSRDRRRAGSDVLAGVTGPEATKAMSARMPTSIIAPMRKKDAPNPITLNNTTTSKTQVWTVSRRRSNTSKRQCLASSNAYVPSRPA
jgi:hypothetical protein